MACSTWLYCRAVTAHSSWKEKFIRSVIRSSTCAASPSTPRSTGTILPISVSSISMWIFFACLAYSDTMPVTRSEKRMPIAISRSQRWVIMFEAMLPCMPAMPT